MLGTSYQYTMDSFELIECAVVKVEGVGGNQVIAKDNGKGLVIVVTLVQIVINNACSID